MMTAGIAATRPSAVASSASAMPGATTARLVVWASEMPMNEFMMPQTVPNRPTNGAVAPMVASTPVPRAICRDIAASTRSSRSATRSLRPSSKWPPDRLASRAADWMICATASWPPRVSCSALASTVSVSSRLRRRLAVAVLRRTSMVLASQIVQVTSEAKAKPTMTACTTTSAFTNMFQGDRLRGSSATSVAASAVPGKAATLAAPHQRIITSSTVRCMATSRTDNADRLRRAGGRDPFGQRVKALQLVPAQRARLVAADEHLEHDAAVDIDERDEGRRLAHEGPLDESDSRAALVTEMAVQSLRLHQVEIAASDLARRDRARELEDRIVGMDDQRHLAPLRDIVHGSAKFAAGTDAHHRFRHRLRDGARAHFPLPRHVLDHRARVLRHMGLEAGKVRAQHRTLPVKRRRWICARSGSRRILRTWDGRDRGSRRSCCRRGRAPGGTLPIWSRLRTQPCRPRPCARNTAYDPRRR